MRNLWRTMVLIGVASWLAACEPEVGSARWCEKMSETPPADWSTNDALEYARSCVLQERE